MSEPIEKPTARAYNLNAMMEFGFCPKCGLVPVGCEREGCEPNMKAREFYSKFEVLKKAKELAHQAHIDQLDKSGHPYIEHVSRVANAVSDDPQAESVAWLHDVLEDAPPQYQIKVKWMPPEIFKAVYALTRINGERADDYYRRVRQNPLALRVKLADIDDNANNRRLKLLDLKTANRLRRKYTHARVKLGET